MADDDFSPTFMRNATAFGPSPRMRFDIVLNNLAGLAWTDKAIRMNGDGSAYRPLVHILDICDAVACALEAPRPVVHNQIFNVGQNSDNYRVKEIAAIVGEVFPGCAHRVRPERRRQPQLPGQLRQDPDEAGIRMQAQCDDRRRRSSIPCSRRST